MSSGKAKGAEGKGKGKDVKTTPPRPSLSPTFQRHVEQLEWRQETDELKGFFKSFLWKYPVRGFIGEVVKGQSSPIKHYMCKCSNNGVAQYVN